MKRMQSSSREFWIAIGMSVAFHVLAGSAFWIAWERMLPEKLDTEMEWTWTAPNSDKMAPGRSAAATPVGEQFITLGAQLPTASSSSGPGTGIENVQPSKDATQSKEVSPGGKTPGGATGPTTAPPASPSSGTGQPTGGRPTGGSTTSPVPSSGASPGYEGPIAGESTGFAIVPPRLLERPAILAPAEAVQSGISGNVLMFVEVLENGRVGKISISRSGGSKILDEMARENVSRWRFEPAWEPQGKKPVRVMTSVWFRYTK